MVVDGKSSQEYPVNAAVPFAKNGMKSRIDRHLLAAGYF